MFLARRPSPDTIDGFLRASQGASLSYASIGIVNADSVGDALDQSTAVIGRGPDDFERARSALMTWKHFAITRPPR